MTTADEKKIKRAEIRALENTLTADYIKESSALMCKKLSELAEYKSSDTVFCFIGVKNEPDTSIFAESVLKSGKRLCVPLCVGKGVMELREIKSTDELIPGAYGIPEPQKNSLLIKPEEVGFAVIPCLACDRFGNRLGKGGGYYDRFLALYKEYAVMLCFSRLLQEHIPTEGHDFAVKAVLTEKGLYRN